MKSLRFLLALLFTVSVMAWAAPEELSLEESIRMAIARNPALQASQADVRVSEARAVQAHAPLDPNIGLFYNWTRQQSPLGPPVHTSTFTFQSQPLLLNFYRDGITLNQLLFDGEKTRSLVRQAEALTDAARSDHRRLVLSLTYQTTQAYYRVLAARHLEKVGEESVKSAQEHQKLVEASYRAGTAARADVVFASVPVATARLNLTRTRQAAREAEAVLNRVLAQEINTPLVLKDDLENLPEPETEETAVREALGNREELKRARSLVESARAQLGAAHGSTWPVVNAFGTYGYTDYVAKVIPGNLGWSFGLQGNFTLFNGNAQSAQVAEAKAVLDRNLALEESTRQDVLLEVKQAYLALESARESVREAEAELAKARENLRLVEGQYREGVVPVLNLLDARVSFTEAEAHHINALYDYKVALARLRLATGK